MMSIEWTDDLKLGLPAIDTDHQELLDLCNSFLTASADGASLSTLATLMDTMILRTRAHFLAEERLLDRHNYPGYIIHKAEHDRLIAQAEMLRVRYGDSESEAEADGLKAETANFLRTWLLDHIRTNDKPYRPFLMNLS